MDTTAQDSLRPQAQLNLSGVPETMLWPLWNRAMEMQRKKPLIDDFRAAQLVDSIDYDFRGHFGRATAFHPVRARVCDDHIVAYLKAPGENKVIVSLGEGLDTQFWRVSNSSVLWLSVDLPEAITIRERLLPHHPNLQHVAASALDFSWMDLVPPNSQPFISAAGLFMYFQEEDVVSLLNKIALRFPKVELFFDTISPWFSEKTLQGFKVTPHFQAPPMPWGVTLEGVQELLSDDLGWEVLKAQHYAEPFPARMRLYSVLSHIPAIRRRFAGSLVYARHSRKD